jgi:peroxin-4
MASNRLMKELKEARRSTDDDIKLDIVEEGSLFKWKAILKGPPDTPYVGGKYEMILRIPSDYPMAAPTASFVTKVFHPNVNFQSGEICVDILKTGWTPAWTLNSVCRAILSLLSNPEADSPLNCDAGNLIRAKDVVGYNNMARFYAVTEAGAPAS